MSLAVTRGLAGEAKAADEAADPAALIGGDSRCPLPGAVWQKLVPLVPGNLLMERLTAAAGSAPSARPIQIVDLGTSFLVIAGHRIREYPEPARDCAERARFAALFIAIATGADPAVNDAAAVPPASLPVVSAVASPAVSDRQLRLRLDVGATAAAALDGSKATIAPGLAVRIAFPLGGFVPVVALGVVGPSDSSTYGVDIRQWQGTVDLDLRSGIRSMGRLRAYGELGAVVEVIADRSTNLSVAPWQVSYAVGPRLAVAAFIETNRSLAPFLLLYGAWFPFAPERFALPAGDLGRAAPWTVGVTGGVSWGLR